MKKMYSIGVVLVVMLFLGGCEEIDDFIGSYEQVQEDFTEIADKTGGEQIDAKGADDVPDKILEIISPDQNEKIQAGSDVVFLIDKTASMRDDIDEVKESLVTILDSAPADAKFSVATFGDKKEDGDEWYSISSNTLSDNTDELQSYVNAIETTGGGDWPESVYDGLWKVMDEVAWESQKQRIIILIGDASPLTGSKTEHSLDDVVEKSKSTTPPVNIYTIAIDG